MNEERHSEHLGERQAERDSQLSAMFDGELPAAECELLARRLTRDEALRSQWSRYSLIGAALRAERGVRLDERVAKRVQAALAQEATYGEAAEGAVTPPVTSTTADPTRSPAQRWLRFGRPAVAAGIAAGAFALSIFWLRGEDSQSETLLAGAATAAAPVTVAAPAAAEPVAVVPAAAPARVAASGDYSTPAPSSQYLMAPPARLANYVAAHSEYSGPLTRRMAYLSLVGSDEQAEPGVAADAETAEGTGAADAP
jgi:sigma-E factor negative regulatory protein RseA